MLKKIVFVLSVFVCSTQALPLLYTFEGSINDEGIDLQTLYQIVIDFDAPGKSYGNPINDVVTPFENTNYGSAKLQTSSNLYFSEVFDFFTEFAMHDEFTFYGYTDFTNEVGFSDKMETRTVGLINWNQSSFQIGDIFNLSESYGGLMAVGTAKLTSISSPISSVPEPNTCALLCIGLLSSLGLRRKTK